MKKKLFKAKMWAQVVAKYRSSIFVRPSKKNLVPSWGRIFPVLVTELPRRKRKK